MPLERQETNDIMRHVPPIDWISTKFDYDYRERLRNVWSALDGEEQVPRELRPKLDQLCKWLHHITVLAKGKRTDFVESDLKTEVEHAAYEASSALSSMDRDLFQRRMPFHGFERSNGELIWEAFLAIGATIEDLVPKVEQFDPDLRMKNLAPHAPAEPKMIAD